MQRSFLQATVLLALVGTAAAAESYADGDRVDALIGGSTWLACTVVRHNVKQGDYEVRCDGRPDTARVPEDADHLRPGTAAVRAATASTNAAVAAMRAPDPGIDANLRPVTLAPGGRPLSGLYLQLTPMMANAALGRTSFDYFYFWPDGRVCTMLPPTGTDPADYDAMKAAKPRLCGRYRFAGDKLTIDVPDHAKIFDYAVSRFDGTNFVMDAYPTVKVQGYADGATLNGRYAGRRLSPYTDVVLTLDASGHFDLVETPADASAPPARHRQGRYRLRGNTLDLDGERHTLFPLEGGRAGRLVLDGRDMLPL